MSNFIRSMRSSIYSPVIQAIGNNSKINTDLVIMNLLSNSCYADPRRLEKYGAKCYSQTDEDGIIFEIFRRIGTTNKTFIEFGAGAGSENNTISLLYNGWGGLWIEGNDKYCQSAEVRFQDIVRQNRLKISNYLVDPGNINEIISHANISGEIDLLSIDIDGNDYYVFDAINVVSPRVLVFEYNGKFIPPLKWIMPYDPRHVWDGSDYFGASLCAYEELARSKGYSLVGTNIFGLNAFFVRQDLLGTKFADSLGVEHLYNRPRYHLIPFISSGYGPREIGDK